MNIILTGVTGTLGSQLLLELLEDEKIKSIFLFIRDKGTTKGSERFQKILDSICYKDITSNIIKNKVKVLSIETFFKPADYLLASEQNYFIHSAGFVNLSTDSTQEADIFQKNFEFSKSIFNTFSFFITKFTYVSTAFSIGAVGGIIKNNYHDNITPNYRNAYEASKHKTEKFLLKESKKIGVKIQILRPSVIGGTVVKAPVNYISKFMVYYLIGKFFYKNPLAKGNTIRLSINFKTGLNIVPVDYVSKVIKKVLLQDIQQLNIVHNKCTNLRTGLARILNTVGFHNFLLHDKLPIADIKEMNPLETFYYNSIGKHLSAYNLCEPYEFDTKELESILPLPIYNQEDFLEDTLKYAMSHDFKNEKW